ncbi:MAG TPA: DUF6660 family protein [Segetibacter sp.]
MAFLVLALSSLPCADVKAAANDCKAKTTSAKATDSQDHEESDSCSPFCHCGCCAGFSINTTVSTSFKMACYIKSHKTIFLPLEVIEIASLIWQPPRLV